MMPRHQLIPLLISPPLRHVDDTYRVPVTRAVVVIRYLTLIGRWWWGESYDYAVMEVVGGGGGGDRPPLRWNATGEGSAGRSE